MQTHLNEWRALRDSFALKAAAALAKHHPAMSESGWLKHLDAVKAHPATQSDGVLLLADSIGTFADWQDVILFVRLADRVWGLESEAMPDKTWPTWGHGKINKVA